MLEEERWGFSPSLSQILASGQTQAQEPARVPIRGPVSTEGAGSCWRMKVQGDNRRAGCSVAVQHHRSLFKTLREAWAPRLCGRTALVQVSRAHSRLRSWDDTDCFQRSGVRPRTLVHGPQLGPQVPGGHWRTKMGLSTSLCTGFLPEPLRPAPRRLPICRSPPTAHTPQQADL